METILALHPVQNRSGTQAYGRCRRDAARSARGRLALEGGAHRRRVRYAVDMLPPAYSDNPADARLQVELFRRSERRSTVACHQVRLHRHDNQLGLAPLGFSCHVSNNVDHSGIHGSLGTVIVQLFYRFISSAVLSLSAELSSVTDRTSESKGRDARMVVCQCPGGSGWQRRTLRVGP